MPTCNSTMYSLITFCVFEFSDTWRVSENLQHAEYTRYTVLSILCSIICGLFYITLLKVLQLIDACVLD